MEKQKIEEVLEDIQESLVESGGNFVRQSVLKEMPLEGILPLLLNNHVEIKIKYNDNFKNASNGSIKEA